MKKFVLLLFALVAMGLSNVKAYDFSAVAPSGQTLYYNIISSTDHTCGVVLYLSDRPTGALEIPSTVEYEGDIYTVVRLANSMGVGTFQGCRNLISVTIPNTVTSIGSNAFEGCSGLTSVIISNSVTSIGNRAFYGCSGLTSVTIPSSVTTIGEIAFSGCNSVDTLYYNACNLTTTANWYNSSSSYNSYGFRSMRLHHLVLGDSVQTLPAGVFYGQSSLKNVTIPHWVTFIDNYAFYGCSNVDTLVYNARNLTMTDSLSSSDSYGFRPMKLKYIIIGDSVQTLPSRVFNRQDSLTSVTFGISVTIIGDYAFSWCRGLTNVTIPNSVINIGEGAFWYCSGLTSVTIPNSVTTIGGSAFSNCGGLTSVNIGEGVTEIGGRAFGECRNLTTLYYNATNCTTMGTPDWPVFMFETPAGFPEINTTLTNVIIDSNVTVIPAFAFKFCSHLTSVNIPNSVTSIGESAFAGCSGLATVTIPNLVTSIGDYAFSECVGIRDLTIGNSVSTIGSYAFYNSNHLVTVRVLADMPPSLGTNVFPDEHWFILCVPCGTLQYYNPQEGWSGPFLDAYEFYDIVLTVESDNELCGTAEILQSPSCDSSIAIIRANANSGYRFVQWNDGNTDNPRIVDVTEDVTYTAFFESYIPVFYTIVVESADPSMGSVTGAGSYEEGTQTTITATANAGYHFVRWNDYNTDNPRTITITEDVTYTAYFEVNPTQGIDEVEIDAQIMVSGNTIAISGAEGETVIIFDVMGRVIVNEPTVEGKLFRMPRNGVYMVKVGNSVAQKVVVVK